MEIQPEHRTCSNCGSSVTLAYCSACGQKWFDPQLLTLRTVVAELARKAFSVDSRWLRTLGPLLLRPGWLTKEYLAGRHQQYVKPLSIFITVNLLFFLIGHRIGLMRWNMMEAFGEKGRTMIVERAGQLSMDPTAYAARLNEVLGELQRSFFFGVILLFSLVVLVVSGGRRRSIGSLVYSIHFHASFLLIFPFTAFLVVLVAGAIDLAAGTSWAPYLGRDPGIAYVALTVMWAYHAVAFRTAFGDRWVASGLKAMVLTVGGALLMIPVGQTALFWIVWLVAT